MAEAGIDGGGLFNEFMSAFTKQAFTYNSGHFSSNHENLLYPNPNVYLMQTYSNRRLALYRFFGEIIGKAMYENILVVPEFTPFFLNLLLGKTNQIHDLQSLDPDLYKNLMSMKYMKNIEDLCLTFSVIPTGSSEEIELIPNGLQIDVTKDTIHQYISKLASYRLNTEIYSQCNAFRQGFNSLIPNHIIWMFSAKELQLMIGGSDRGYDVVDMQRHCTYYGYHATQPYIQDFWDIVNSFSNTERANLLQFITSCSRPPLNGFRDLQPPLCIHEVNDDTRLPTAATCMNLLKLPRYPTKEILREKLSLSINSKAGFELS